MKPTFAKVLLFRTLATMLMLQIGPHAIADPPIWANAKRVKATFTECGALHYLLLKGDGVDGQMPPASPGCTATDKVLLQVNVAKVFFRSDTNGSISEPKVDAAYLLCSNGDVLINLGRSSEVENSIRQVPAPKGCAYTKVKYQLVSSVGKIAFTNVANGGTMSVAESLAKHANERERAIAECNASAACLAEQRRLNAINAYYDCIRPKDYARTCYRPW
jgi:hypothetical protein